MKQSPPDLPTTRGQTTVPKPSDVPAPPPDFAFDIEGAGWDEGAWSPLGAVATPATTPEKDADHGHE